jgi:hypothetical protein
MRRLGKVVYFSKALACPPLKKIQYLHAHFGGPFLFAPSWAHCYRIKNQLVEVLATDEDVPVEPEDGQHNKNLAYLLLREHVQ